MSSPRKLTLIYRNYKLEHSKLLALNEVNQESRLVPTGAAGRIDNDQFYLLSESVFFSIFRTYENTIEKIFINYMLGEPSSVGRKAIRYVSPRNYEHARMLVKSNSNYIDWISPSTLIDRAELYFEDGFLIKPSIASNQADLLNLVRLRNHIAHNSDESLKKYKIALRESLKTIPINVPNVGEFLNMNIRGKRNEYFLTSYFAKLHSIIHSLTH